MATIANGLWWDHSKSVALAPTITLPVESGGFLLTGLAILVTIAGGSFWNITAFVLHHCKAKGSRASAVERQIRVNLRNSAGAIRALWDTFKLHQAWSSKKPSRLLLQTCTVALPACLVWAGFSLAALFTSSVTNKAYASVVARVHPQTCGIWSFNLTSIEGTMAMAKRQTANTIQARNHVANFYSNNSSSAARSIFVKTTLPYTTDKSARCPIPASQRCTLGQDKAFAVTSGLLDSHDMLGINAKPEDRVHLKLSLTCSPILAGDLRNVTNHGDSLLIDYNLGPLRTVSNYTYRYNTAAANNTGMGYVLK